MTSASPRSTIEAPWAVAAGDVVAELAGSPEGLTSDEARARLARDGPNAVEQHAATPRLVVLARQFRSPLIYILLVAALVTVALGEYVDAGVIAVVLVINAIIGYVEETRAERSVDALRRLASTSARVLRDRREIAVDATHLVVGDVVLLEAGAKAPADCRILHATSLEADESLLTGESVTAGKSTGPSTRTRARPTGRTCCTWARSSRPGTPARWSWPRASGPSWAGSRAACSRSG